MSSSSSSSSSKPKKYYLECSYTSNLLFRIPRKFQNLKDYDYEVKWGNLCIYEKGTGKPLYVSSPYGDYKCNMKLPTDTEIFTDDDNTDNDE